MIGLMGAMDEEVNLYVSYADIEQISEYAGMVFHCGRIEEMPIVIVKCGVGKVNAAVSTQILIDRFNVNGIVFTGLAGALVPYLQQGDIVVANNLIQYDVDLSAFGRRIGDVPSVGRIMEADAVMIRAFTSAYDEIFGGKSNRPQMIVGTVVSGDKFISDIKTIAWLQREFGAIATEMEGAAVAQVCRMNTIPFLVIRTISDGADENAAAEFDRLLEMAPINTFALIRQVVKNHQMVPV